MTRTQIQLPDPLHQRLKRIARENDWSLAEVIRRAGELYAERFPPERRGSDWQLPEPFDLGEELLEVSQIRVEAESLLERNQF